MADQPPKIDITKEGKGDVIQFDESGEVIRIPLKVLTTMMLAGENALVLQYLKLLPKDECAKTRARLIRTLEEIQKKTKAGTVGRTSGSKSAKNASKEASDPEPPQLSIKVSKPSSSGGSMGKSSSRSHDHKSKPAPDFELPENKQTIGNYTIEEELGKGMFGTVFKGRKIDSNLIVAVKQIDKEMIDKDKLPSIMREAQVLESLSHIHIMGIYEVISTKKNIYFILEFIDCGSLSRILKTATFTENYASPIVSQVLEGLKYLHGKGIVHRDIKCDNILINSEGSVKLADFGTAKAEDKGKSFTVVGTPFWMAPEVIEMSGGGTISDIWSLGCTVVEMMSGEPPNFRLSTMQALFNIVEEDHPPIPDGYSEPLMHLLVKCCFVKNPKMRPSADDLLGHPWIKLYEGQPQVPYAQLVQALKTAREQREGTPETQRKSQGTKSKGKAFSLSGQSVEELQAFLDEITRERDLIKAENAHLKKQIEALT